MFPTQEDIAEAIMAEVIRVTDELGEEAGLIFLSGIRFGVDLAMSLQGREFEEDSRTILNDFYTKITKGEIN